VEVFVGVGASRVRDLFEGQAKYTIDYIIVEIDAVAAAGQRLRRQLP
jgi:ATP-dependent Zn protease